ncbi:MAG: hypothetical protein UY48_C0024G0008 [Candidatus Gottesmanbacteria bacterium GW2011_GWB1_49_7]|uniref:Methyltransferase type 11 n=1 Tax=Candidatus Gottesmanbacteria bacterium GW2011_GWB1_49_7 TaxID=1618448 RepID=A0A0G1Y8H9_9BACT|nr:MAG: hypothetical protein UY48_C0024G0008 [Candidatus Gottesmanbacteria bacterium GW2011_GWB1_49_7]
MGDSRRFHLFAKLILKHLPLKANIVDISGGKGYLQAALRQNGYMHVTSWDKRKKYTCNRQNYRYGYFNWESAPEYEAVVAMHPDEGTDHAILYAASRGIPGLVCPCCIKPDAVAFWQNYKLDLWYQHLEGLALKYKRQVTWATLPMNGRSQVMIIT